MIVLTRDSLSRGGTHGTFELGGRTWHSIEPPDLGNRPFKSCIPQGDYELIPHASARWGNCFIMSNPDLNVYTYEHSPGRPEDGRFLCLFVHRGNFPRNFVGCCGASHGYDQAADMLLSSTTAACRQVNRMVDLEGSYELRIQYEWE